MSLSIDAFPAYDSVTIGPKGYQTPDGLLPRVTTVNRIVGDATEALIRWSADTERAAVLAAAGEVFAHGEGLGPPEFIAEIEAHLGAARQHVKKLAEAAEIGTSIHTAIQNRLRRELGEDPGPPPVLKDQALWAFMSWEDWRKTQKWRPVRVEQPIWSKRRRYAGTADCIAVEDGIEGWVVPDWKSSKGIYSTHHLQLGAYCDAIEEMTGIPVANSVIVKTPKTVGDDVAVAVKDLGDLTYDYMKNSKRVFGGKKLSRRELTAGFDAALVLYRLLVAK